MPHGMKSKRTHSPVPKSASSLKSSASGMFEAQNILRQKKPTLCTTSSAMSAWRVEYHTEVIREDSRRIDAPVWNRVRETIELHYALLPTPGKPLSHELRSCRTLRIGDWRAICRLKGSMLTIFTVRHRSRGYGPD